MKPFYQSRWFGIAAYLLIGLSIAYLLLLNKPILLWIYRFLRTVLTPFIVALIISYVLNPIVNRLTGRKMPRTIAILLIYAVFLLILGVLLLNLIPIVETQMIELNEHIPKMTAKAETMVTSLSDHPLLPEGVRQGIEQSLKRLENSLSAAISQYIDRIGSTLSMLLVAFIIPFLAFYILKDFKLIEKSVITFVPSSHRKSIIRMLLDIDRALGQYIRGQLLVAVIVGALAYLGYWLIGMPYALLLAGIVSVFNIVPYIGPFFGAAPAILMAATVSWKMVLYVVIVNTLVQILEGNVVSPQVVGRTLHMHPLTIILALLIGGELAGIVGLILAVPCLAVLKVIVQHVRQYYIRRKRFALK